MSNITELTETPNYYSETYHYLRYPAQVSGRPGAFCVWSRDVDRPNPEHVTWNPETIAIVADHYRNEAWHAERAERAARVNLSVGDVVKLGNVVIEVPKRATEHVSHVPCKVIAEVADPYIFITPGGSVWFNYPNVDEADESEIKLETLPAYQADALLRHGFPVVVEGVNDDDTLALAEVVR